MEVTWTLEKDNGNGFYLLPICCNHRNSKCYEVFLHCIARAL